jgi:two-component system, NarL family, sensor histidine kinase UhpB
VPPSVALGVGMRAKGTDAVAVVLGWLRKLTGSNPAGDGEPSAVTPVGGATGGRRSAATRTPALTSPEAPWAQAALYSSHGMAIVDPASASLRAVNAAYAQLVGRTPEQLEGQPSNTIYPPSEHVQLLVAEHAADLNGAATLETRQCHRDGWLIPVEVTLIAVRDGNGPVTYRIQTVTDLRARPGATSGLRLGEAQETAAGHFRQLADSAPVGILLMGADGGVSYANPCWLAIADLSAEQARGDGWWDAICPDDRERVSDAWEELRRGAPLDLEFRYRRGGGELRSVQSRAVALRDDGGRPAGFMCVEVDVTERLQRRAALDGFHGRIRALAQRLEQLREDERAGVARRLHGSLRQDMTTLKGEIESLCARATASGALPAAAFDGLTELAGRCLEELRSVTFELQPPGVEELGLTEALQRCAGECAAQSGLRIDLTDAGDLPDLGARHSLALYRTFQEALANVVRHARARQVEAHVWVQDGSVHLRVSDDGVGIGDRDRGKPGCFGLLSAAERLTQLGGALRVFGVPGRGTTLDASVPLGSGRQRRATAAR